MDVTPFVPSITPAVIEDLRRRLSAARWAGAETVDDWSQGVPLAYLQDLCAYWADGYDFGVAERIARFPGFRTTLTGEATNRSMSTSCTCDHPNPAPFRWF